MIILEFNAMVELVRSNRCSKYETRMMKERKQFNLNLVQRKKIFMSDDWTCKKSYQTSTANKTRGSA
jgi:hypothetical protein